MKIMVSACLLGENCKYNGGNNYSEKLNELLKGHEVIPICPEVLGGLPTPRHPAEIVGGVVTFVTGKAADKEYRAGAALALSAARAGQIDLAILQSRSPSCGVNEIYDGTFTKTLIPGMGVFAKLMKKEGFKVLDIEDVVSEKVKIEK